MLRNALYLDTLYKTDCENKINYRLIEADSDIDLTDGTDPVLDEIPLISLREEGKNLLGDQVLGSNLSAITIKVGENPLKTILISSVKNGNNTINYFKFINDSDQLVISEPESIDNLNEENGEN